MNEKKIKNKINYYYYYKVFLNYLPTAHPQKNRVIK